MEVNRKEFKKCLDTIKVAMNYKAMVNYGEYVVLSNDRASIYNGDMFMSVPFTFDTELVLPARELIAFVNEAKEDTVSIEHTEEANLLTSGRKKVKFFIPPDQHKIIEIMPVPTEEFVRLPDDFFTQLEKIDNVVSKRKDVKIIGNFYVTGKSIVASDSYRIGKIELQDYLPVENDFYINFIIAGVIQKNKMIWLNVDENYHFYSNDDGLILGIAEEAGRYIDYHDMISNDCGIKVLFPEEMVDDIKISSIFNTNVNSLDKVVDISVKEGIILITGNNNVGSIELSYEINNETECTFSVHPGFFLEGLKNTKEAMFNSSLGTLLFTGESYRYIINTY